MGCLWGEGRGGGGVSVTCNSFRQRESDWRCMFVFPVSAFHSQSHFLFSPHEQWHVWVAIRRALLYVWPSLSSFLLVNASLRLRASHFPSRKCLNISQWARPAAKAHAKPTVSLADSLSPGCCVWQGPAIATYSSIHSKPTAWQTSRSISRSLSVCQKLCFELCWLEKWYFSFWLIDGCDL